jgi:hypothetical protein
MRLPLAIVAAIADNGVIGRDNRLIWRLRSDLRRFRDLTWGKPMIMGRKTYDSIGKPLPGRRTVVLTRDRSFAAPGVEVAHGWDQALARADALASEMGTDEISVIGGAEIYAGHAAALPDPRPCLARGRYALPGLRPLGVPRAVAAGVRERPRRRASLHLPRPRAALFRRRALTELCRLPTCEP